MNFLKKIILFFIFSKIILPGSAKICKGLSSKYMWTKRDKVAGLNVSTFTNFKKFSDLILDCNRKYKISSWVHFLISNNLIIDNSFNLQALVSPRDLNSIEYLIFDNLWGIDINRAPFIKQNKKPYPALVLAFYHSKFDAYSNGRKLDESHCNLYAYNNTENFLQSFFLIYFRQVAYPKQICPLIFRNSHTYIMYFGDINNSFLIKNRLKFFNLNVSKEFDLDMIVFSKVVFDMSYEYLTNDTLNKHLFKKIFEIKITGVINGIQNDMFGYFKELRNIFFKIDNVKKFFHGGTKWMNSLNSHIKINFSDINQVKRNKKKLLVLTIQYPKQSVSFDTIYEYPDEDICLFKDFPHENMVYPAIVPGRKINCTCTLLWLQKYNNLYEPTNNTSPDYNINSMNTIWYNADTSYEYCNFLEDCQFEKKLKNCQVNEYNQELFIFSVDNDVDVLYLIKWLQFILLTILQPILCLIGILNNTMIIVVITNKSKKKEFKDPMYHHIHINAFFNLLYCSVLLTKLINTCLFFNSQVFCSSIYQYKVSQYFKIIVIFFFGNVFKLCSNISYLSFSFSRLILVSMDKENSFYVKFKRMNFKIYFICVFLLSCVISVFLLFQYDLNNDKNYAKEFPYEIRDEGACQSGYVNKFECRLFNAFKIINSMLSSVVCVILNLTIDLRLLKNYTADINKKLHLDFNKNKIEELKKKKKKVTKMVMIYGIIFVISHLPEFCTTILLIIFAKEIAKFCIEKMSCDLINEEAEFFNLISIVCNYFIFRVFDKNFKESLNELKNRIYFCINSMNFFTVKIN